ncbi:ATP-binding cassette domain-containing protein [candidate division KSB1 bacterium]|nr:ATP-binding cassette domain-containing protein [candidate division KSB1 bacterium]
MIKVRNLWFKYTRDVLQDISLDIHEGESIAIMGSNGSGKTTFARCLNGLLLPSRGTVVVEGLSTADNSDILAIRKQVGMVFQNPDNQIVSATVEREIAFGLENLGVPFEDMHQIVGKMLLKFDLERYKKHTPHALSGGEKQKLALASVLAMQPRYLILDEPTSLLDPRGRKDILRIIGDLHKEKQKPPITTIFITQFPEEADQMQRLIIFHKGRVVMDDCPFQIFQQNRRLKKIGLEPPLPYLLKEILAKRI